MALLTACVAVMCVRLFFAMMLVIPADGERPVLWAGDRVWVSRVAYGVRFPWSRWWGYRRLGFTSVERGHWVAFNNPACAPTIPLDRREVFVGRCLALPGDTLWFDADGNPSLQHSLSVETRWPVVVPAKGQVLKVEAWSAPLYAAAINGHEGIKAAAIDDSLCVSGKLYSRYRFKQDFYWMASTSDSSVVRDSRVFGFVPESHLIGRLSCVLYSLNPGEAWYRSLRRDRIGVPLP